MTSDRPYAGVRVLDLSQNVAGPYGAMILGDLGADVIKLERPGSGDDTRTLPPLWEDESVAFVALNRNKRSIELPLKSDAGREAALRIGEGVDVVLESFRPGVTERLGLDFDAFAARNPSIIYCSISAFGEGPIGRDLPGYDPLVQAFSGIMAATGHEGTPPVRVAASIIDLSTGMWAAMRIMSALAARAAGVQGPQHVQVTLVDSALNLMCHQVIGVLATGTPPPRVGSGSPLTAPYEVFDTADGPLLIAAGNDTLFSRLCGALSLEALLEDPRFARAAARVQHRDALHAVLEAALAEPTDTSWEDRIRRAGVPVGPVQDLVQAVAHPIVTERGLLAAPEGVDPHSAMRLLRTPLGGASTPMRRPPRLGEHTEEVLRAAGLSEDEIRRATA